MAESGTVLAHKMRQKVFTVGYNSKVEQGVHVRESNLALEQIIKLSIRTVFGPLNIAS